MIISQKKTVRTLALRAGNLCSNPDCRHPTSGPHSAPDQAIITGEAAHICAAAEEGPRFDPNQTPEERKSIANAFWLCGNCNKKVDSDWKAWPKERLHAMKAAHEKWISAEAMIPAPPIITLKTQPTLRFSGSLLEITPQTKATFRDQELIIENPNRVDLFNVKIELNLPEVVVCEGDSTVPIGSEVRISSIEQPNQVNISGNASAMQGPKIASMHHLLEADKLGAGQRILTGFYTAKPEMTMPYDLVRLNPGSDFEDPEKMDEHRICFFFLEGTYQFILRNEYVTGQVFVPLLFTADSRIIESRSVQGSTEPWRVYRASLSRGATLRTGAGGSVSCSWTNVATY